MPGGDNKTTAYSKLKQNAPAIRPDLQAFLNEHPELSFHILPGAAAGLAGTAVQAGAAALDYGKALGAKKLADKQALKSIARWTLSGNQSSNAFGKIGSYLQGIGKAATSGFQAKGMGLASALMHDPRASYYSERPWERPGDPVMGGETGQWHHALTKQLLDQQGRPLYAVDPYTGDLYFIGDRKSGIPVLQGKLGKEYRRQVAPPGYKGGPDDFRTLYNIPSGPYGRRMYYTDILGKNNLQYYDQDNPIYPGPLRQGFNRGY